MVVVDSMAYRAVQIVPWNIVRYNVLSGEKKGPNIFGTEPWWFYLINLSLKFNICGVIAFISLPLLVPSLLRGYSYNLRFFIILQYPRLK
jgi:alpha-1,2-mannosyltransferase